MKNFFSTIFQKKISDDKQSNNKTDNTDNKNSINNTIVIPHFKGDISLEKEILEQHSKDCSIFKITPQTILYPKDKNDIVTAINYIRKTKLNHINDNIYNTNQTPKYDNISLSVRAGGTCMSGGSLNNSYILNLTKYMNNITIDTKSMTAEVEMGAMFKDIADKALIHNLMFAPYPSSKDICGIGGMIGNNASGEKSVRFGATIDNIISLEIVLADGTTIHTSVKDISQATVLEKNLINVIKDKIEDFKQQAGKVHKIASGYRIDRVILDNNKIDITPIFVGAQATLGIITKAKIKLTPIPQFTRLIVVPIEDIHNLPNILKLAKQYNAESIETFDINTYNIAKNFLIDDTQKTDFVFNNKTSGIILIQFSEETLQETNQKALEFYNKLKSQNIKLYIIEDKNIQCAFWNIRRNSFSLIKDHHNKNERAVPCIEDIIIPIENFEIFIPSIIKILQDMNLNYAYHGHIGDGSLRIIPLFDFTDKNLEDNILSLTQQTLKLIKELNGNISADHSDGIIRTPFIREFYGEEIYKTFENIKQLFDPLNIINPNKKVNGTKEMIKQYIDNNIKSK